TTTGRDPDYSKRLSTEFHPWKRTLQDREFPRSRAFRRTWSRTSPEFCFLALPSSACPARDAWRELRSLTQAPIGPSRTRESSNGRCLRQTRRRQARGTCIRVG